MVYISAPCRKAVVQRHTTLGHRNRVSIPAHLMKCVAISAFWKSQSKFLFTLFSQEHNIKSLVIKESDSVGESGFPAGSCSVRLKPLYIFINCACNTIHKIAQYCTKFVNAEKHLNTGNVYVSCNIPDDLQQHVFLLNQSRFIEI